MSSALRPMHETILLVEDDPPIRLLIRQALTREGYLVLESRHGEEALNVFLDQGGSVDLLITDMRMPHLGGAELIQALRAVRSTLKVLCITGYERNVPADGRLRTLLKPFSRDELLTAVREVLDGAV
jgi:two-component system cell cycle sensor histidine kinase/response regulator CckA